MTFMQKYYSSSNVNFLRFSPNKNVKIGSNLNSLWYDQWKVPNIVTWKQESAYYNFLRLRTSVIT